jgi:hypothetical protein
MMLQVPVTTLDLYVDAAGLQGVDFIKIDAEGAELEILRGGDKLLVNARPVVMCEVADVRTQSYGYRARDIVQFLCDREYCWFKATARGGLSPAPNKRSYAPDWENLIAVPKERTSQLSSLVE